jgi:hypothetical protein
VSKDFVRIRIEDLDPDLAEDKEVKPALIEFKVFVYSEDCNTCKDILTKDFIAKAESEGVSLVNVEEAFVYGADFLDSNLLNRDITIRTPTVIVAKEDVVIEATGNKPRIEYLLFGKISPPKARSSSSEARSGSRSRSKKRAKTPKQEEFLENKKIKKVVTKALSRCDSDVCVESEKPSS